MYISMTTLGIVRLSILTMTPSIKTCSLTTFSIMALGIMTLSKAKAA
jgi:hypothetical protein